MKHLVYDCNTKVFSEDRYYVGMVKYEWGYMYQPFPSSRADEYLSEGWQTYDGPMSLDDAKDTIDSIKESDKEKGRKGNHYSHTPCHRPGEYNY